MMMRYNKGRTTKGMKVVVPLNQWPLGMTEKAKLVENAKAETA